MPVPAALGPDHDIAAVARAAVAALVKHRARALARQPTSLDALQPGLAVATPETLIAVARRALDTERQRPQRWTGFGGDVRALNAKALLLLGRARRRTAMRAARTGRDPCGQTAAAPHPDLGSRRDRRGD